MIKLSKKLKDTFIENLRQGELDIKDIMRIYKVTYKSKLKRGVTMCSTYKVKLDYKLNRKLKGFN